MRVLVHLSDLHFGRIDERILSPLIAKVRELQPHVVAVSGDFTQRARPQEFREAREFLKLLPQPQIVVPGNHDLPLHNLYARFRHALDAYQEYISNDVEPFYLDPEIAVTGANTARRMAIKGGRINHAQIDRIEERLCGLSPETIRVQVTHHPLDLPETYRRRALVRRAPLAMNTLARCRVDLLMAGHFHRSHTGHTAMRYPIAGHSAVFILAGTLSTRHRGEPNSFNVIRVQRPRVQVERMVWKPEALSFSSFSIEEFHQTSSGWTRAPS